MKNVKTTLLIITTFLTYNYSRAQDTTSIYSLAGGKWTVCVDMKFSKDYQCDKGYTTYEFINGGVYKEDRQPIYNGKKMPFVPGKWTLVGNTLTIDEDDDKYHKAFPHMHNIIWLDKDRFYATGQEGPDGPTVYTYFQRTK